MLCYTKKKAWPKKNVQINGYTFGYIHGMHQIFLFDGASKRLKQQCEIHESCGSTLCIGEIVLTQKSTLASGNALLTGFRIRDGLKSCCVGCIEFGEDSYEICELFDQALSHVAYLTDEESSMSEAVNGSIKLILLGVKNAIQLT